MVKPDYSQFPNFIDNLKKLIDGNAIPDTLPEHIGHKVIQAIDELTEDDIKTLIKIATTANAHLFVHDTKNKVVAMGL